MSQAAIAERYARAILELAAEENQLAPVTEQIQAFADAYQGSPELRATLHNPGVLEAARDALLKDLGARLAMSTVALNAVRLMSARRRLGALGEVATMLRRLADERAGVLRATVTSPRALPEDYYQRLSAELEKRTQRRVLVERLVDPSLIAGVVTRIGDHTIDGSVKGRLAALSRQLLATT